MGPDQGCKGTATNSLRVSDAMPELWTGQLLSQGKEIVPYRFASLRKPLPRQTVIEHSTSKNDLILEERSLLSKTATQANKNKSHEQIQDQNFCFLISWPERILLTPPCWHQLLLLSFVHFKFAFSQIISSPVSGFLLDIVKSKLKYPISAALIILKTWLKLLHTSIKELFTRPFKDWRAQGVTQSVKSVI